MQARHLAWACAAACAASLAAAHPDDAAAAPFGSRTLHLHSRGHDVRVLQRSLTKLQIQTAVDGAFGRETRRSVRRYERRNALRVDGRVTPREAHGIIRRVQARALDEATAPATGPAATETDGAQAVLADDGLHALAPASAPQAVKDAIAAANRIVGKPYRYGGGHGGWEDSGYDCSGTVSYALHGAGLLDTPRDSTGLESFGRSGEGAWITVYANSGHAYAIIAGLRLDTSGPGPSGPHWRTQPRSSSGYVARHPRGL